jgi:hypothetical protein
VQRLLDRQRSPRCRRTLAGRVKITDADKERIALQIGMGMAAITYQSSRHTYAVRRLSSVPRVLSVTKPSHKVYKNLLAHY